MRADQQAFPMNGPVHAGHAGLTKREYFAALIAAGYIAGSHPKLIGAGEPKIIASYAVQCADALIAELAK